ncbi:MAG: sulfotransferase [Ardenticatenaceae bacterium]|nr:sulfotransferase [Ardenticatenaceae bacterium]
MDLFDGARKYTSYVFDRKSFDPNFDALEVSPQAVETARRIRAVERGPAVIIHGIMPRSGTVYVGDLLGLHPDLALTPNKIWEIPFLKLTDDILRVQEEFFRSYKNNRSRIGAADFLPLFGAAFVAHLHSFAPEEKRMLLKMPGVQHLNHFFSVFPHENLLLLVRDGRDVVHSTVRTWPELRFSDVCRRWNRSVRMILAFQERYAGRQGYWMTRFEDAVRDPEVFVKEACSHFGLDGDKFPYEKIEAIPVQGSSSFMKEGKARYWVKKPRGFNPIGRWEQWPAGKKRAFKRIAGEALMDLGYCDNLDW